MVVESLGGWQLEKRSQLEKTGKIGPFCPQKALFHVS